MVSNFIYVNLATFLKVGSLALEHYSFQTFPTSHSMGGGLAHFINVYLC